MHKLMVIASVVFELGVEQAFSLKDKRRVIFGLKARLKNKFNIAVSETGSHDIWNRAEIAVVTVSAERQHAESMLSAVMDFVESYGEVEVISINEEIF
ncbi:DUF503 domain-containing protein [Geovibrio ferrireducens]|uniref:DUF503 domain-containing protein n=1 Tax=Geovibrio ferrireducens TaxID=46201 RepID=UPI002245BDF6|nr:DUF503 domain-containing protein [Geovibrio ferrireducens]